MVDQLLNTASETQPVVNTESPAPTTESGDQLTTGLLDIVTKDNTVEEVKSTTTSTTESSDNKQEVQNTSVVPEFLKTLPQELQSDKSLNNFKNLEDLAKSYIEARKLIGKRVEDMTPEQIKMFSSKFGVPNTPDDYDIKSLDEEYKTHPDISWYKNTAHEVGFSQDMANKFFDKYVEYVYNSNISRVENHVKALKEEWGFTFDKNVSMARKGVEYCGGEALSKALSDAIVSSHPDVVKAFAKIGGMISEDSTKDISDSGTTHASNHINSVRENISKFESDNREALFNNSHPDHSKIVAQRVELYRQLHGVSQKNG